MSRNKSRDYNNCIRGARHILRKQDPNNSFLNEYYEEYIKTFSVISKFIFDNLKMEKVDVVAKNGKKYKNNQILLFGYPIKSFKWTNKIGDTNNLTCINQYIANEIKKTGLIDTIKIKVGLRNIVQAVLSNYDAELKRHKHIIQRSKFIDQKKV